MRARQLKPGFFKNEDLAECSYPARIVFAGLWTMADRAGRLEDRPKRIKAELLPFDDEPIGPILDELAKWGFILRYEANGIKLIWIPKFHCHQNPHKAEKPSAFPAHPDDHCGNSSGQAQCKDGSSTVQAQCKDGSRRASSPIPSSPIPDCFKNLTPPPDKTTIPRATPSTVGGGEEAQAPLESESYAVSLEIQQIGEGYPEHRYDPGAAEVALKELSGRRQWPGLTKVLADIDARCQCDEWTRENGRLVPKLSRYIRDRTWLNPIPQARAAPPVSQYPEAAAIDQIAQQLRARQKNEHELPENHDQQRFGGTPAPGSPLPPVQTSGRARSAGP